MFKLLSGQQLYTAKSIHAQKISESVATPPFEPPRSALPSICVVTRDEAYELCAPTKLVLGWGQLPPNVRNGAQFAPCNWRFNDPPWGKPSYYFFNNAWPWYAEAANIPDVGALYATHYVTSYPYMVYLATVGINNPIWPGNPGWQFQGGTRGGGGLMYELVMGKKPKPGTYNSPCLTLSVTAKEQDGEFIITVTGAFSMVSNDAWEPVNSATIDVFYARYNFQGDTLWRRIYYNQQHEIVCKTNAPFWG